MINCIGGLRDCVKSSSLSSAAVSPPGCLGKVVKDVCANSIFLWTAAFLRPSVPLASAAAAPPALALPCQRLPLALVLSRLCSMPLPTDFTHESAMMADAAIVDVGGPTTSWRDIACYQELAGIVGSSVLRTRQKAPVLMDQQSWPLWGSSSGSCCSCCSQMRRGRVGSVEVVVPAPTLLV